MAEVSRYVLFMSTPYVLDAHHVMWGNGLMDTFRKILRKLRKDAGLTQEKLAHKCGWNGQSRVGNYESGIREPTLDELPLLAKALDVQIGAFFGEPPVSQSMILSAKMLLRTIHGMRHRTRNQYSIDDMEREPEKFIEAYSYAVSMPEDAPVRDNVKDITGRGQPGYGVGRSDGVPPRGTAGRKVGSVPKRNAKVTGSKSKR